MVFVNEFIVRQGIIATSSNLLGSNLATRHLVHGAQIGNASHQIHFTDLKFPVDGTFPGRDFVLVTGFFRGYPLGGNGLDLGIKT